MRTTPWNGRFILAAAVLCAVLFGLRAQTRISDPDAREQLRKGAILVDVRTPEEFKARHLTNAVNIPLAVLKEQLPKQVPDKSKVVLVHCQSGGRSANAEKQLREMGYTNAFNIGSYARAEKIATEKAP